jgi:alcohol dehydrogenase class-P
MTNGGVDRSVECTGNINAMIQAFECVHDVRTLFMHILLNDHPPSSIIYSDRVLTALLLIQGWGVAVLVGVPHKDAEFKTHPMNFLNERTLKGTFFGNYKPRTDLPNVVELYMKKVNLKRCSSSSLATSLVVNLC